jgi:hypothetical protein
MRFRWRGVSLGDRMRAAGVAEGGRGALKCPVRAMIIWVILSTRGFLSSELKNRIGLVCSMVAIAVVLVIVFWAG